MPQHRLITKSHRVRSAIPVDVWTLFSGNDIYNLTLLAPAGGVAASKPAWLSGPGGSYYAEGLAPAAGSALAIIADDGTDVFTGRSTDDGGSWSATDSGVVGFGQQIVSDRTNRDRMFAVGFPIQGGSANHATLAGLVPGTTGIIPPATALSAYTNWEADLDPFTAYTSTDGGATWTPVQLAYCARLFPTQFHANIGVAALKNYAGGDQWSGGSPAHTLGFYESHMCPDWTIAFAHAQTPSIGGAWYYDGLTPPNCAELTDSTNTPNVLQEFIVCDATQLTNDSYMLWWDYSVDAVFVASCYDNAAAFVVISATYYDNQVVDGSGITKVVCPLSTVASTPGRIGMNVIFKLDSGGTFTSTTVPVSGYSAAPGDGLIYGSADPTNSNKLYAIGGFSTLVVVDYSGPSYASFAIPVGGSGFATGLLVTTQGTVLLGVSDTTPFILRSTTGGSSWSTITPAGLAGVNLSSFWCTEYQGTVGGAPGVLVVPLNNTGKYLYSTDDGVSWNVSGDLTVHDSPNSNSAR